MPKKDKQEQEKQGHLVIDAVEKRPKGADLLRIGIVLILLALAAGFVVGFACLAVLRLVDDLQELFWEGIAAGLPEPIRTVSPILLCLVGGLAVGLATKRAGFSLETLGTIVGKCRAEGGYRIASWPWTLLLFALPIAFGGAVGPEAGISGFAAALVTSAIHALRRSGVAAVCDPSRPLAAVIGELFPGLPGGAPERRAAEHRVDGTAVGYGRGTKAVLWGVAAVGFVLGVVALVDLAGPGLGLPRFEPIDYLNSAWGVGIAALAVGWVLGQLSHVAGKLAGRAVERLGTVGRAVACGAVLGAVAVFLPDVLFSGQQATRDLAAGLLTGGTVSLALTCVAKLCLTQLCVKSGWVGGEFFPLIFCGASAGYVLAGLFGVDPALPAALGCGALVAAATGRPAITTCVLALCFPIESLPAVAVAAFVAAKLPAFGTKAATE